MSRHPSSSFILLPTLWFFIHFFPPSSLPLYLPERWVENIVYFCSSAGIVDWQLPWGLSWQQFPLDVRNKAFRWLRLWKGADSIALKIRNGGGRGHLHIWMWRERILGFFFLHSCCVMLLDSCSICNFVMCRSLGWGKKNFWQFLA